MQRFTSLILMFCVTTLAHAGSLTLRDGQTLSGDITLEGTRIIVTPKSGSPRGFDLAEIAQASFSAPPGPTTTYVSPAKETSLKTPDRKIFAEYFSDKEFKQPLLRRFESQIDNYWGPDSPPDPSLPARYGVRYSFQVVPPASAEYAIALEAHGEVRLWIDDELKIDEWQAPGARNKRLTLMMTQKKPVNIRFDVYGGQYGFLARFRWNGPGLNNGYLHSENMEVAPDVPATPRASIISPRPHAHYLCPDSITFEINAEDPAAKVERVELFADHSLIGSATKPPYAIQWNNPPAGYFHMTAKAINDKAVSNRSDPLPISVATAGEKNSLPKPWGQQTLLEKKDSRSPGVASFEKGTFTLSRAGGQITEGDDGFLFVYQRISGDFDFTAHLASLSPADNFVGPLAGLMIRDSLRADCRAAAIVVGPASVAFVRKAQSYSKPTTSLKENTQSPLWIKLSRHGNRVRVFTSSDGKEWALLAGERLELPEELFVGLCDMARSKQTPASATFDHVSISPGAPALLHTTEGILYRGGTFLACELHGMKENGVIYTRNGKRVTQPAADVARLIYRAVPCELAEAIPADRTGVLLGSGDFIDGELKEVNYRVTVSNLVFGPRTFGIKTNDVLAIYLKEPKSTATPYTITATDGSIYKAKTLKVEQETLQINDASLGDLSLPIKELAQLKVN